MVPQWRGRRALASDTHMRGGKPKPIQTKINEGDRRGRGVHKLDQRLAALPKAQRGLPDAPDHFTHTQRGVWDVLKQRLEVMELDYSADAMILEGLCVNYVRAVEADLLLERDGCDCEQAMLDKNTGQITGYRIKNHPAVARSNMCWKAVQAFASDLGLTIVSRQRISMGESANDNMIDIMERLSAPYKKKDPNIQ